MVNDNLKIWNNAQATDPKFTKEFKKGGGFSGTAINATWMAKRATETFGPIGIGWGVTIVEENIHDVGDGKKLHVLRIKLWYMLDGKRGEVEHFGQTMLVDKRQSGTFVDEEAPKKSLTDAMTKALSLLGFAADVHMGMYDDNKYVNAVGKHFEEQRKIEAEERRAQRDAEKAERLAGPAPVAALAPPQAANSPEATQNEAPAADAPATADAVPSDPETGEVDPVYADIHAKITAADTINKVTDLMLDPETQKAMAEMSDEAKKQLRDYGTKRLKALGWGKKAEPKAA
ncbi:hypothetical protein PUR29_34725 [Methylobacterium ajmalii]|uniref:Uncharacterized protein n=1 Tax=Methylobacterium ajmalii TaxID=2738439 RepID=A0ABV0A426_9HYPH